MALLIWLEQAQHELLLFSGVWFLIGAIDDLLVDLAWLVRRIYRRLRYYRKDRPMRAGDLPAPAAPGKLAVFVAAWQESDVIENMRDRCSRAWKSAPEHFIYVGCYPNDNATIMAVNAAAARNRAIRLVLCTGPGPTTNPRPRPGSQGCCRPPGRTEWQP